MTKTTKTKTTKTKSTKKTKTVKNNFVANLKTPALVRKGFRAYVGVFGAAYEAALPHYEKAVKSYDDYAARGEKLETIASDYANDTRKTVTEFAKARFEKRSAQLRSFVPGAANDRVVELEAEIAKLNKKIANTAKSAVSKTKKRVTTVAEKASKAA